MKCNRTGSKTAHVTSSQIQYHVGGDLADTFGWEFDSKHPNLEVVLFVADERWVAGIPVLRQVLRS